jgi:3-phenylpropionate/trans-cinnamate dioxygenase ferredoxin subunit
MTQIRVCGTDDVPEGEVRRFEVDSRQVAVVNMGQDGFRAIDAVCSHERYFLDEGDVDLDMATIECPKHGSQFDLETGRPKGLPAIKPVAVFAVTVDGDDILIEV